MYYRSFLYLIYYFFKNVVFENSNRKLSGEQLFLKNLTGIKVSKKEADFLWTRINDHKWYVSERLHRDIGFNAAAVDFLENIYQPKQKDAANSGSVIKYPLQTFKDLSSLG